MSSKICFLISFCLIIFSVLGAKLKKTPFLHSLKEESNSNLQEIYDRVTSWTSKNKATSDAATFLQTQKGCFTRWMDFTNYRSNPGWELQQSVSNNQGLGRNGWWMKSYGTGAANWSRLRFKDYTFNSYPGAKTHISVVMRGAPDGGKNSNAYLIQTKGKYNYDAAIQDGTKDEIDFSEYYGNYKQTYNVFRRGTTISGFPGTYPISDAGRRFYKYEIVLDNALRNLHFFLSIDGQPLLHHREVQGNNVPDQPMELFIGIFDCSNFGSFCPGKFTGEASMEVQSVWVQGC